MQDGIGLAQELRGLQASEDRDRPGRRRRYGRCPRGTSRRRASSSSPRAARRAAASSPARARRAAGPRPAGARRCGGGRGSTIRALTWARKVAGQLGQAADALGQYRLDAAAQGGGAKRRRGAAGRDRHHDAVAIDDRRQDEVAESRPVGHVHRHAERLGDALGHRVVLEIAGGNEDGGRATQVINADVGKLVAPRRRPSAPGRRDGRRQAPRPPPRPCGLKDRRTTAGASPARRPAAGTWKPSRAAAWLAANSPGPGPGKTVEKLGHTPDLA